MRTVTLILTSFFMCILHIVISPMISIFGAKVDFVLISIVLTAMYTVKWYPPVLCAVYSGLIVDIVTQPGTYINTGMYLFLGIVAAAASLILHSTSFFSAGAQVLIGAGAKHILYVFVLYVLRLSENLTLATFLHGVPSALYSGVVAIGFYFVYKGIFMLPYMQDKKENEGRFLS